MTVKPVRMEPMTMQFVVIADETRDEAACCEVGADDRGDEFVQALNRLTAAITRVFTT